MVVTEIFKSIQGESTYAGRPCIFVRLTGCNLRCRWCDTAYAFYGGTRMGVEEVLARVREFAGEDGARIPLVELTGGEPMLQPDIHALIEKLLAERYTVLIETSGERYLGSLPPEVIKIMDIKCPGSGEGGTLHPKNLGVLDRKDEIKFVIADEADYGWARDFLRAHRLTDIVDTVIFSPVFGELEPRVLSEWILRDRLPVRLGLQLHKFIWEPDTRGV
ncbi:MAG: radical SAM protein [Acidobacteria bacterium]|nr:radical SAM protein [Acidobacteriota bacterium]